MTQDELMVLLAGVAVGCFIGGPLVIYLYPDNAACPKCRSSAKVQFVEDWAARLWYCSSCRSPFFTPLEGSADGSTARTKTPV